MSTHSSFRARPRKRPQRYSVKTVVELLELLNELHSSRMIRGLVAPRLEAVVKSCGAQPNSNDSDKYYQPRGCVKVPERERGVQDVSPVHCFGRIFPQPVGPNLAS